MIRTRAFRHLVTAATCFALGLSLASPAAARSNTGEDAMGTVTKVSTGSGFSLNSVDRFEDYMNEDAPAYLYYVSISGMDAVRNDKCTLSKDGRVLQEDSCWIVGAPRVTESGKYTLAANGRNVISFTFTNPGDTPPALVPAVCKIKSVTPAKMTATGVSLKIATNGKCKKGDWSYGYASASGVGGGGGTAEVVNGVMMLPSLTKADKGAKVTVRFTPSGYTKSSSKTVAL